MPQPNIFVLAADGNTAELLPLLQADHSLASSHDSHGYSLLHAAASYGHESLVRQLVNDFHVDVNLKDEDGESPLFQVESVAIARVLVEDLQADARMVNDEAMTAADKIGAEGDWPLVAAYLRDVETATPSAVATGSSNTNGVVYPEPNGTRAPPPLPPDVSITVGAIQEPGDDAAAEVVDPEFKRRIEHLAARDDFRGEAGQRELRNLITDAVRGHVTNDDDGERESRRRTE